MSASPKEIANILEAIEEAEGEYKGFALASVVDVEGSSYRRTGARMLIQDDGTWTGSISGGCLEGNALRRAREVIHSGEAALVTYDTRTDASAKAIGASLGCNGIVHIWLEPLSRASTIPMLRALSAAFKGPIASEWVRVLQNGHSIGIPDGSFLPRAEFLSKCPLPHDTAWEEGILPGPPGFPGLLLAFETVQPAVRLLLFGAGDDVKPLVQLGCELGWRVTVTYDCPAKTLPRRFPGAEAVLNLAPEQAVAALAEGGRMAAVIVSHNYAYDLAVLQELGKHKLDYLGILGPRKRHERLCAELGFDGGPNIHAPMGLDIGAQTPFEIALAVIAEVHAVVNGRSGSPLSQQPGFIHPRKTQA